MEKVRKVFLENLPKWGKENSSNKGRINWNKSIGFLVHFIYDDIEGDIEILNYVSKGQKLTIRYNKNIIEILTEILKDCQLGKLLNKVTGEFKVEIGTRFQDDKRDIIIIDREYREDKSGKIYKYYKYHCNIDKNEDWIREGNLLKNKNGCNVCSNKKILSNWNSIWYTHKKMVIKYKIDENFAKQYSIGTKTKCKVTCPNCGEIKLMVLSDLINQGLGCICQDGFKYPEKFIFAVLKQLKIDFQTQLSKTTFNWCQDYRYDFCFELNGELILIEANGIQHYEECTGKWKIKLKDQQKTDKIKKELAINNGIKPENYIVIDCRKSTLEHIKNNKNGILNSRLNELFDLSNIDWLKVNEFATKNIIKEVCEYWNNKKDNETVKDIAIRFDIARRTTLNYLHKGVNLGWCNYDSKEELRTSGQVSSKYSCKKVEIFKDGISLGIFESARDIERESEKIFGIKLLQSCICNVCLGKQKSHKGFTFIYVEENLKNVI
jgi:hypothetical protein